MKKSQPLSSRPEFEGSCGKSLKLWPSSCNHEAAKNKNKKMKATMLKITVKMEV